MAFLYNQRNRTKHQYGSSILGFSAQGIHQHWWGLPRRSSQVRPVPTEEAVQALPGRHGPQPPSPTHQHTGDRSGCPCRGSRTQALSANEAEPGRSTAVMGEILSQSSLLRNQVQSRSSTNTGSGQATGTRNGGCRGGRDWHPPKERHHSQTELRPGPLQAGVPTSPWSFCSDNQNHHSQAHTRAYVPAHPRTQG